MNDNDRPGVLPHVRDMQELGLRIVATRGTAEYLNAHGVEAEMVIAPSGSMRSRS